jgi:hypothetical protein
MHCTMYSITLLTVLIYAAQVSELTFSTSSCASCKDCNFVLEWRATAVVAAAAVETAALAATAIAAILVTVSIRQRYCVYSKLSAQAKHNATPATRITWHELAL